MNDTTAQTRIAMTQRLRNAKALLTEPPGGSYFF
jgi:hypothetical protein